MQLSRSTSGCRKVMIASAFLVLFIPLIMAACSGGDLAPAPPVRSSSTDGFTATYLTQPGSNSTATTNSIETDSPVVETNRAVLSIGSIPGTPIPLTPSKTSTATKIPTRTRVPTNTRAPTRTPTATRIPPTPDPQDAPIRIYNPASYSKIVSPFQLFVAAIPGADGNVHMRLTGENRSILSEKTWIFPYANGRRTTIDEEVSVDISGLAESARLTIFTLDKYGRMIALTSEDLLFLSVGKTEIMEAQNLMAPFTIRSPYPETVIRRGIVQLRGITRTRIASALFYELIDQKGNVVGSYASPNVLQPSLEFQDGSVDIPYKVKGPTLVRLIMHQVDIRNGMDVAVSSMLLKLYP